MRRIAAPMIGGMLSSTVLTLVVIPAVYSLWRERQVRRGGRSAASVPGAAPESRVDREPVASHST